ncbi:MAG: hypothetical protein LUE16_00430 [Lachnospiraceae bacterium]|nr:hypothetical protein [Lachnospiraceae bacterium]
MCEKIPISKKVQNALNVVSPIASAASLLNPAFLAVPVIASVYNEVCAYFDSRSTEKRLNQLEKALEKQNISNDEFRNRLDRLDEHDQYVFRNNVKHLCVSALPETTDVLIDCMIAFLMDNDHHQMNEELCEILRDCNSFDMYLLQKFKEYLLKGSREEYNSKLELAKKAAEDQNKREEEKSKGDKKSGFRSKVYYDRNVLYGRYTIFWKDFMTILNVQNTVSASAMINKVCIMEDGSETYDWAYLVRSLLKLQRLGVVEVEYHNTMGVVSQNNIDRFHVTLFGKKLLDHIEIAEQNTCT